MHRYIGALTRNIVALHPDIGALPQDIGASYAVNGPAGVLGFAPFWKTMTLRSSRLLLTQGGAALLLTLGIWVNTGTLAPYGATLKSPLIWAPCNYPLNIDNPHFKATFLMLDGAPRSQWELSVVLRRILYPLLAYPFMKLLGFGAGGLVTNVLLAVGSLAVFWLALRRRLGSEPPTLILALLATYPGWMYWAGLPYSYAAIVPLSLLCMVLLWRVEMLAGWRQALLAGLAMGVLFTGYDLLPFFGAAGVLLLLWRRLRGPCAVFAVAMVIPTVLTTAVLWQVYRVPFHNGNTEAYYKVIRSYISKVDLGAWWYWLRAFPWAVRDNYFFSNFLFLPVLVLLVLAILGVQSLRGGKDNWMGPVLRPAEICLAIAAVLLFLFLNLAPPYGGWQLRGSWVPRLYQPVFVAMISVLAAFFQTRAALLPLALRRGSWAALGLVVALQVWVVFAPVLGAPGLSGEIYYRFYHHASRPFYADNLKKLGTRPVGFCGR
ncbi:MAG TPA: hypothetical protein VGQ28_08780 [Thermoanaerobaculia bacterium]|nr:hypothetical protein [Thermoanaerobaculia bacterium]